ncbi:glycogen/starch synthase, partial [Candidatus Aerophobetes bacterium]|nr:glycogen/starch synthase [Candidatus Aerophobetes bacterium]
NQPKNVKELGNGLIQKVDSYRKKYIEDDKADELSLWREIKSGIEQIVNSLTASSTYQEKARRPLILVATPEVVSLPPNMGNLANIITTGDGGGLADISAALIAEFDRLGLNVHVALPEYRSLFKTLADIGHDEYEILKREIMDYKRVHLITDDIFTDSTRVYGDPSTHLDKIDLRKANAFQRGIISRLLPDLKLRSRHILVHCNDWMTGLIPAAAKVEGIKSLMTFHNIFTFYQWPKGLQKHSIDIKHFWKHLYFKKHPDVYGSYEENYEKNEVDFMTSGLWAADFINTVSPTFLKEIVQGYFMEHNVIPEHMREVIRIRYEEGRAAGILNAPAINADPRKDNLIVQNYWHQRTGNPLIVDLKEGKDKNKQYFQGEMELEVNIDIPLFFWPSRITRPQKGFELLLEIIPQLMSAYKKEDLQIAVVANGDLELIQRIKKYQSEFPKRISYKAFNRKLSQIGKAASDFILMPSLYEPCGIPQVEAPRYGTLPIVRRTGGLADTVEKLSHNGLIGNGFVFEHFLPEELYHEISEAIHFYRKGEKFRYFVQKRIMRESFKRFNIERTAKAYIELYEKIFRK